MKIEQQGLFGESKITKVKPKRVQLKTTDYAFRYQSLGAGLQSSTITEMIVEGELAPVDVVIFADTGDEPQYVYEQVEYLRGRLERVNIPLFTVSAGNILDDLYSHGRFASMPLFTENVRLIGNGEIEAYSKSIGRLKRQCTKDYKIVPIQRHVKHILLERGLAKVLKNKVIKPLVQVECWLGISFDELQRMKPSRDKWVENTFPLIDKRMTKQDCIEWLKARGLPIPLKSSCRICPYHSPSYFRNMKDNYPNDFSQVITFDDDLRNGNIKIPAMLKGDLYLVKDCIPLSQVDLSTEQERGQLDMCDEGYCFI